VHRPTVSGRSRRRGVGGAPTRPRDRG
jgi:hypothetical protein